MITFQKRRLRCLAKKVLLENSAKSNDQGMRKSLYPDFQIANDRGVNWKKGIPRRMGQFYSNLFK